MTLFFYVLRDYFRYVFGIIFLCTFLFVLFDFIHKSTKYLAKHNPETAHLIQFYALQIPSFVVQALPIASLLSSVITMVLLSRTNEVTAMRAVGMGPLRVGLPIATGGVILSFASLFIGEFVVPVSSKKMHFVQTVLIEKQSERQLADGTRWVRDEGKVFNFQSYDIKKGELKKIRVIYTGKSFRPKKSVEAETATFDKKTGSWDLSNVKILYFWPNGTLSYTENTDAYPVMIPIDPSKMQKERRLPNEMSSIELFDAIKLKEASGAEVLGYKVDFHVKFAFHFASFVVSLIGLKFGYKSERSMETARGILLAIIIGVSYWFILNGMRALGMRGTLPPFVAAWSANFIIFGIACFSILRTRKS